jgi:hypothetical protein
LRSKENTVRSRFPRLFRLRLEPRIEAWPNNFPEDGCICGGVLPLVAIQYQSKHVTFRLTTGARCWRETGR